LKIIDNYLSPEGLEEIRTLMLGQKYYEGATHTNISHTELGRKIGNTTEWATIFKLEKDGCPHNKIHTDGDGPDREVDTCVFYPWDNDAPLELPVLKEFIQVKTNRAFFFNNGKTAHLQHIPKDDNPRYSLSIPVTKAVQ